MAFIASRIISDPAKENTKNEMLRVSLLYGPPSLLSSLLVLLSTKKIPLIELLSPVMFIIMGLMVVIILATEITGELNSQSRQNLNLLIFFIFWTFALFLGVTWRYGFIARNIFIFPTLYVLIAMRDDEGDEVGPVAFVGALISVFLVESSVYSNMKAKAQLFYKLQFSEQQQRQMKSLLDAVPDNVIICSKATERKPAKAIFAN